MLIDLQAISEATEFTEVLEEGWWRPAPEDDQILGLDGPLHLKVKVSKAVDKFLVQGTFRGAIRIRCDRCLEPFHKEVESQFHVYLMAPREGSDQEEIELFDEDMEVDFVKGDKVDLSDVVREQIYLSLPMQSICKDSCRGLCPVCGANWNDTSCSCRKPESPSAFSKLRLKGE
ncbi:MAG: DUF177 domain-containing protein [Desulfobacterota bacterium]|jgi:uncharacterized protein|nr:DUF177 domain-containing protein [Thermodesulfobacteriota bacterium]